jgi:16S rRNA (uracil1498-N3)-methyltransferase
MIAKYMVKYGRGEDMQRYFIPDNQYFKDHAVLKGNQAHHITKVMRQSIGDSLVVFNQQRLGHIAQIESMDKGDVVVRFIEEVRQGTVKYQVDIAQALIKKDAFEWMLQKATELGVNGIIPISFSRCVVQIDSADEQKKHERFVSIMTEASEQSERSSIPVLFPFSTLYNLPFERYGTVFVAHAREDENRHFSHFLKNVDWRKPVLLIIGPEGGITNQELTFLQSKSVEIISLGTTILRSETASLKFLSAVDAYVEGMYEG